MRDLPLLFTGDRVRLLARLVGVGLGHTTLVVVAALCLRSLVNAMSGTVIAPETFVVPTLLLLTCAVLSGALRWLERVTAEKLGQGYVYELRLTVFDHLAAISSRALSSKRKGTLITRFVTDVSTLKNWISSGVARACVGSVSIIGGTVALIVLQPWIGLSVALVIAASVVALMASGAHLDRHIRDARRRRGHLAINIAEKLHGMATIQAYSTAQRERAKVSRQSRKLVDAMARNASATGCIRAGAQVAAGLCSTVTVAAGAWAVAAGRATTGDVVAALGVVAMLSSQFYPFGRLYQLWRTAEIARERTRALLGIPTLETRTPAVSPTQWRGTLVFNAVSVDSALDCFSGTASAGQRIAIKGPNGAGKSTLLQLANRMFDPDSGSITLDGVHLPNIALSGLRRHIALVSADLPLMRGTIYSNITYGISDARPSEVRRVTRRCGMDITSAESVFHSKRQVNENGNSLSKGERMRIALARALVLKPTVLLIDEADAGLDSQGLRMLKRVITEFEGTVIFVTHRRSLADLAEVTWELDGRTTTSRSSGGRGGTNAIRLVQS